MRDKLLLNFGAKFTRDELKGNQMERLGKLLEVAVNREFVYCVAFFGYWCFSELFSIDF